MSKTWLELYKEKLVSAAEAVQVVKSGDRIWYGSFNGQPVECDKALAARKDELLDVIIQTAGSVPPIPQVAVCDPSHDHFVFHSWYFTKLDRVLCDQKLLYYSTINYHECRKVVEELYPPKVAILQVAPMDQHGFFNFGPNASHHYSICMGAPQVIVEVNETIPRCLGGVGEGIHVTQVTHVVEGENTPIFELPLPTDCTATDEKIAALVLEEIDNRACLQLGIGSLPFLIGEKIADAGFKDLGIHSEMFIDVFVDMFEKGCITGKYKTIDRGKASYTFAMGTRRCYEFMNDNPLLASYSGDYTNDPKNIARNKKVVSVNNAVQVDLFSQIAGESYGYRQISGTGGQLDFVQGAFESEGGKSIMCLNSTFTNKQGELISRIVPCLQSGAIVTSPRSVISYVVTENGIAFLKGKSTWERAEELIKIAHPKFQDDLVKEAQNMGVWRRFNQSQ